MADEKPNYTPYNKPNQPVVKQEPRQVTKVAKGSVSEKKRDFGDKVKETFNIPDAESVLDYVIFDVAIPALKACASDALKGFADMIFGGGRSSDSRLKRDAGRTYVSYDRMYNNARQQERGTSERPSYEIVFTNKVDAENVLSNLIDMLEEYGEVSVKDLRTLAGTTTNYTMEKWGWTNIGSATVERVRDGYLLKMPKPIQIG